MCIEIEVRRNGESTFCETVGDLRRIGLAVVVRSGYGFTTPDDDYCLCSVDADATAAASSMIARRATDDEGWPFPDTVIEPLPTNGGAGADTGNPVSEEIQSLGRCCYGGIKPRSSCTSCAAWKPVTDGGAGAV